jgi:predicted ATP-dependent protease
LADAVTVHTDPSSLPEVPDSSEGLFALVPSVARRALDLGLATREASFHVFVAAEPEVMIEDDVVRYATQYLAHRTTASDIVYVHDFDQPAAPRPLVLPPGVGPALVEAMAGLIARLRETIPTLLDAEEVRASQEKLGDELETKNRQVILQLESTAKTLGFGVKPVQGGMQTFPMLHGKPLSAEQFAVLDESTKKALGAAETKLTREVEKAAAVVRALTARIEAERERALTAAANALINTAMQGLLDGFAPYGDDVRVYIERVHRALLEDWHDFLEVPQLQEGVGDVDENSGDGKDHDPELATRLGRFRANLFVSHKPGDAAPIIYDTNPTYPNLFGCLERRARFGALLTDFTRIRAGSLHRASGGVLVVRAADVLADPIIWERLKRVLRERRVGAEDPLGPLGLYATSLRPVPVPLRVRVVMVGKPELYAMLLEADPDFASLFRVKVEVEPSIPRNDSSMRSLDAYLMDMAKQREWGEFDRSARAKLLDLATRLSGERNRLALILSPLEETAAFASAIATARAVQAPKVARKSAEADEPPIRASILPPPSTVVSAEDIAISWKERRDRMGSAERHIREITLRGEVSLDTSGLRVGVVNGLSVYSAGDVEFGQPMRVTAVVALGREGIVDVEREAQLGGPIHTKGVHILRGYLLRMFGQERPLSLRAQIAFEQSYGEVEGDSASSAELYAVLSGLADVPIDQGIAITGSVNQLGEIQAIGGVCAKIEGFFELCRARGLTGTQGVLLPRTNLQHLVLREDIANAIASGQFHIYAAQTVEEGIEVLTGVAAGQRDVSGRFPATSVFGRVERRIIELAELLRVAEGPPLAEADVIENGSAPDVG